LERKYVNHYSESDFFAQLIVEAFGNIKLTDKEAWQKFNPKSIHILKNHGKSLFDSQLINGYALMTMRSSQGMPLIINKAKIACLDMSLNKFRLQPGIQVLVTCPDNLQKIRQEYILT
jgi:T-complex protein 1 subunit alpha